MKFFSNYFLYCSQTSVDLDNIKSIVYHSENFLNNTAAGYIDSKYFQFM